MAEKKVQTSGINWRTVAIGGAVAAAVAGLSYFAVKQFGGKIDHKELAKKGIKFFGAKKYEKALECFSEALAQDHSNSKYLINRANVHLLLGNYEEALEDAIESLKANPKPNANALYCKGRAQLHLEKYEEALRSFREALTHSDAEKVKKNVNGLITEVEQRIAQIRATRLISSKKSGSNKTNNSTPYQSLKPLDRVTSSSVLMSPANPSTPRSKESKPVEAETQLQDQHSDSPATSVPSSIDGLKQVEQIIEKVPEPQSDLPKTTESTQQEKPQEEVKKQEEQQKLEDNEEEELCASHSPIPDHDDENSVQQNSEPSSMTSSWTNVDLKEMSQPSTPTKQLLHEEEHSISGDHSFSSLPLAPTDAQAAAPSKGLSFHNQPPEF